MAKHRPVQVLIKPASADCNMQCRYCFYLRKASLYPETKVHRMAPEVQEEMVRQILRYGGPEPAFSYQGGEPTLMGLDYYKRAAELQRRLAPPGAVVRNSMQTNGVLIDEEWAAFLAQYRFLVGLSLDGPPDIHDANRIDRGGAPTHERVMRAARVMGEYGVDYNILTVISRHSQDRAAEVYRWLRAQGWTFLQFIPAVEFDPATARLADWSVGPEAYGRFMCEIFDEWVKDFEDGKPTVSVRLFDSLLHMYLGLSPPSCTFRRRCGVYVVIEHNGDVYPCDFFVEERWKLGNLMENSLRTLAESPLMREFGAMKADLPGECLECRWRWLCQGGCTKDRMRSGAPGEQGLDYFCASWKTIFEHVDATMRELKAQVEAERPELKDRGKKKGRGKRRRR